MISNITLKSNPTRLHYYSIRFMSIRGVYELPSIPVEDTDVKSESKNPDLATLRFLNAVWPIRHFGLRIASAAPSIVMGSLQESESGTNPGIPAYFRPDIVEDLP